MTGRILKQGDIVVTPGGQPGRVLKRSKTAFFDLPVYERYDLNGEADVLAYTVLLDTGEIRQFSFDALEAANRPST